MRPAISGTVLAELLDAAPARVKRKLDAEPTKANTWSWTTDGDTQTIVAGSETVRISTTQLTSTSDITCTCLLSPRCLHVLAVASLLELADDALLDKEETIVEQPSATVTDNQMAAIEATWTAGTNILASGLAAADLTARSSLLHAAHACRVSGLHRLAASATALASAITRLGSGGERFVLSDASAILAEVLLTSWRLKHEPTVSDFGVPRRKYEPLETVLLTGLLSVPVVSATGFGGAVTYLTDAGGRLFSISDVRQDLDATTAYQSSTTLGGDHSRLCRRGLFLQNSTATLTGRIGSSQSQGAATTETQWSDDPGGLWSVPLSVQLDRVFASAELPWEQRREGSDLLFIDASSTVSTNGSWCLSFKGGGQVNARPASIDKSLQFVSNARRLASQEGTNFRWIVRVPSGSGTNIEPLAVWHEGQMFNLGFELVPFGEARGVSIQGDPGTATSSPLTPLRQLLDRVALGGRTCAGAPAAAAIKHMSKTLRSSYLSQAASLVERLCATAALVNRDMFGRSSPSHPDDFATVWAACSGYTQQAEHAHVRQSWRAGVER